VATLPACPNSRPPITHLILQQQQSKKRSRKEYQNPQKKKTQSHDTSKIKQRAPKKIQNTKSKEKKAQHYDGSSTTSGLYRNWLVGLPSSPDAGTSPYLTHSARLPRLPPRKFTTDGHALESTP
jgi:hypothetical protein